MPLRDDEQWICVENLRRQEREDVAKVERGEDGSAGDFGSYYALLTGKNAEWVKAHAISEERYLASYARQMHALIRDVTGRRFSFLDAGCGPGILTNALAARLHATEALGIDIGDRLRRQDLSRLPLPGYGHRWQDRPRADLRFGPRPRILPVHAHG